jgi:hypothetical protein
MVPIALVVSRNARYRINDSHFKFGYGGQEVPGAQALPCAHPRAIVPTLLIILKRKCVTRSRDGLNMVLSCNSSLNRFVT